MNKKQLKQIQKELDKERFQPVIIDNIETDYLVSSKGYIISTNYRMKSGYHQKLSENINRYGYHTVCLYYNGSKKHFKVHRLVANAFIPNLDNKPEVNHKNGDKDDNSVDNLEWATRTDNMRHAVSHNLHKALSGEDHPGVKYSDDDVIHVCELLSKGIYSIPEISNMTGMNKSIVSAIYHHRHRKEISCKYDFSKEADFIVKHKLDMMSKYDTNTIHDVCKKLEERELSMKEIANITGVDYGTIKLIRLGQRWKNISSQYNIVR